VASFTANPASAQKLTVTFTTRPESEEIQFLRIRMDSFVEKAEWSFDIHLEYLNFLRSSKEVLDINAIATGPGSEIFRFFYEKAFPAMKL
jgi:hypothetical protein